MAQHRSSGPRDLVITSIKGDGSLLKFWALSLNGLETVKNFESHFQKITNEIESSCGFSSEQIPVGLKCVVKSKIKQMWVRARVLAHQGYTVLVHLLDYGNEEVISVADVRSVDDKILSIPSQAIECILADVIPSRGNEWSVDAINFCEQHLLYNTLSCFVVSEYMKLPVVRVAKKGENEAFVQRLINSGLALIKSEKVSPQPSSYKMNNMDQNSTHLVRISCIENAHKFYVQLSAAEVELKHLMDAINRFPKESLCPLKTPAVHTPCLAQLASQPHYCRALITFIQQTRCKVFFVDYGFTELKDVQELRAIPPVFLQLAAQAICCSLPKETNIDTEEFKHIINYEHLELHVLNRTTEAYIVKLFYRGHDILLSSQNYVQQKLQPGAKCEVIVSYVNDLTEFYCQLTQLKEQQNIISSMLSAGHNFSPISLNECIPGKSICVKFSEDDLWYRARVIKVNHENDIEVFFVDFGNYDNVSLSTIRKIGPDVLQFPIQAFKCYLFETTLPSDIKARDSAFDLFEELTTDKCLFAHINSFSPDSGYGITLYSRNSTLSINEKIQSSCLSIPVVPVNDTENVYVTSFDSPSSFFVQFEKLDSDKLTQMQAEINSFYSASQNNSFIPNEGNLVCARFNEDDQFYRARVEKSKDGFCYVYFIDYGNRESIPLKDVHCMDISFTKYPQFGIECSFENCPSQIPNDKLSSVMLENSIQLKMIRKENDKWYVLLSENFPGNVTLLELMRQYEKAAPRSILGTGLGGYQEKSFNSPEAPHTDLWCNDSKISHVNSNNDIVKSHNEKCSKNESPKSSKPTKEFEDYSLISIPSKAYRNVYVSHVISPTEFYCQIEEDSPKLQLLMKTIEDIYMLGSDNLNLSDFVVNAPCCAVFEDGAWYRGKIKKVDVNSCVVFFVDYGNTDAVIKSKIKKLRNDLFRWPSQAVCCKSFNISPKGKDWSNDEINAFIDMTLDKSFVAQFVECDNNGIYAVNLVSIGKLEDDIFNKEFVSLGYGRLQDSSKSLVLNSHAASTNLSFGTLNVKIGSSEDVQVTFGLNPGEIFCQLKCYAKDFNQMMINLQDYYNKVPEAESLIDRPHQGMICAAQFFLDSAWYRAEIKKVETNKIVVFYVDYGNCETVDRKKVRCIIQEYTTLPMQAVKCRIRGIKPPGKLWTVDNNLGKYFEGNAVCKFISKDDDFFLVDMTCNQKDVAKLLISDGLAVSDSAVSKVESPNESKVKTSDIKNTSDAAKLPQIVQILPERKDSFVPGQLISVTVSFIENPSKFWCQLLDESEILNELMADIETQISDFPSINAASLNVGSYCIAQYFEDEAWYRAQIKSFEPDNTYNVFFIDYGNSEVVSESQIKMMLPEFMEHSPQCFQCCLQNTPSKLLSEMTTLFRDTVQEVEEITAKVESVSSGHTIVTLLFDKDDQEMNVNELLFGVKEQIDESDTTKESPRFLLPDVPLGLQDGYVSTVNSPQDFYIQLASIEGALDDLLTELADASESSTGVDDVDLYVGYACCSKYSEDNNWYRSEVIAIQDSTVDVLFVDYGNTDTVSKDSLKSLNEKHLQMPPLAIKCKLNGIVPLAEEWSEEAINTFQDMVLESCLGITFISKDIPAAVNIAKDDKEIAQCLVEMELANVESCTETDEAYAEDHLAPAPIEDPLSSLPNDQSYPERKLHSTKHVVKICYVDSYDKFYVTPLELGTELDTVMATLDILYASTDSTKSEDSNSNVPEVLEDPKVSMPCVAKYSADGAWYRALITEVDGENIYVTFIDYGNSEITTLQNLRPLTPELVKIPPIALECSLFGIQAIAGQEQEISAKLEEYFVDEVELEMEICEFSPYKIKLFNNGDIASMLIKEGLAKEISIIPVENENFIDNSKMTFVDESLEYRIQISKRFFSGADKIDGNVKFCEVENDLVVFHVVSTDLEDDLQNLQQKLQDAYSEPPQNLLNVACMDFCATKYMEDENWYRAQVLSCDKEKVKVRFIDYGNCETVDISDIYELLPDFSVEPQFSVKCVLFGLKVDKNKEVELQNKLDEYVYHEPVELNLCKHSHAVYDLCITSLVCGDTNISEMLTNEMLLSQQYIISSQLDARFKATVQKIQSDIVFLFPLNVTDERTSFQCKLQDICQHLEVPSEIQAHFLYAAEIDNSWYRVSVINISGDEVTIDLVDFGSTKVVLSSKLVLLPIDICHQPIFLQPCFIVPGDLTGSAKIGIEDLIIGSIVSCEVQKIYPVTHPFTIRILDIDSNHDENVINNEFNEENIENEIKENADTKESAVVVTADIQPSHQNEEYSSLKNIEESEFSEPKFSGTEEKIPEERTDMLKENVTENKCDDSMLDSSYNEKIIETTFENCVDKLSEVNTDVSIQNEFGESTCDITCETEVEICDEKNNVIEKNNEENELAPVSCVDKLSEINTDVSGESTCDITYETEVEISDEKENVIEKNIEENELAPVSCVDKLSEVNTDVSIQNEFGESTCDITYETEVEISDEKNNVIEKNIEENELAPVSCHDRSNDVVETNFERNETSEKLSNEKSDAEETKIDVNDPSNSGLAEQQIKLVTESGISIASENIKTDNCMNDTKLPSSENIDKVISENEATEIPNDIFSTESNKENYIQGSTSLNFDISDEKEKNVEEITRDDTEHICDLSKNEIQSDFEECGCKNEIQSDFEECDRKNEIQSDFEECDRKNEIQSVFEECDSKNEIPSDFEECGRKNEIQSDFEECDQNESLNVDKSPKRSDFNLQNCDPANMDIESEDVVYSSEDIDKENNRGIEETYQLSGSVQVKVSDIAISDGSVIFAVQPLYLEEEFLLLKQTMQDHYSSKTVAFDISCETNFCVVLYENEWRRGKILQGGEDTCTIMLIDYGKCITVDTSNVKNLDGEHSNVPPFAVWCTLSSVICPPEKNETAKTFLCDKLENSNAVIKILEGGEPYKINLFIDGSSVLNQLLQNSLVTQKLPHMYLEPGSHRAKLSFLNVNSETVQIFVNLLSFLDDYNILFEAMQSTYKLEKFVTNVVESGIYAAFCNDSWYRGLVVSSGNEVQVYLVDTGETITGCKNLCFLLPEHCLQPAYAIPCHIPFSDIQATNEISEAVNNVLRVAEFLVNIEICSDSNSISATLIDEQIVSEVKSLGLSGITVDSKHDDVENKDSLETEICDSSDVKVSNIDSSPSVMVVQEQETNEQFVEYLEETFTTEPVLNN